MSLCTCWQLKAPLRLSCSLLFLLLLLFLDYLMWVCPRQCLNNILIRFGRCGLWFLYKLFQFSKIIHVSIHPCVLHYSLPQLTTVTYDHLLPVLPTFIPHAFTTSHSITTTHDGGEKWASTKTLKTLTKPKQGLSATVTHNWVYKHVLPQQAW